MPVSKDEIQPNTEGTFQVGATRAQKLDQLAHDWGFEDGFALIEEYHTDSLCPGICRRNGCDYSTEVEPDCEGGWCENCEAQTVDSAMILAGII